MCTESLSYFRNLDVKKCNLYNRRVVQNENLEMGFLKEGIKGTGYVNSILRHQYSYVAVEIYSTFGDCWMSMCFNHLELALT